MLLGTLKKDREIKALLHCADNQLDAMGYTEHSFRHVSIVCQRVEKYSPRWAATKRRLK